MTQSAHLLQPAAPLHAVHGGVDAEELAEVAAYKQAVLHGAFSGMDATRARAKAVRTGIAAGQDQDEWRREDVHATYALRTAQMPMLSVPARYSGTGGVPLSSTRALSAGGRPTESKAAPVVAGAGAVASTEGYQFAKGGEHSSPEREGCMANACPRARWCTWYACGCWLCPRLALGASRRCTRCCRHTCRRWLHRNEARSPEESALRSLINAAPELLNNTSLVHFLNNEFKAVYFYYRQVDMLLLLGLAITVVFFSSVGSRETALLKLFVTLCVVMSVAAGMIYESPFLDQEKWKENVKVYSLILAVTSGLLNYVTFVEGELQEFPFGRHGSRNLSILVFIMSMGLFFILITSFWRVLVRGAEAEAKALARRRRRMKKHISDLPTASEVSYVPRGNPLLVRNLDAGQQREWALAKARRMQAAASETFMINPATEKSNRQLFSVSAASRRKAGSVAEAAQPSGAERKAGAGSDAAGRRNPALLQSYKVGFNAAQQRGVLLTNLKRAAGIPRPRSIARRPKSTQGTGSAAPLGETRGGAASISTGSRAHAQPRTPKLQ